MKKRFLAPGFFLNEELAECEPMARLLFLGLTLYADREGKFEWRPKRIHAVIFPYDIGCDILNLLESLRVSSLIVQYNVNGNEYGIIPKYLVHQSPHKGEKASKIPDPPPPLEIPSNSSEVQETPITIITNTITNKTYTPKFENLWGLYPRRIDKKTAYKKYRATLKKGETHNDLLKATRNYGKSMAGKEKEHIKHGATFFGPNEPWKEWVDGIPEGFEGATAPARVESPTKDRECKKCTLFVNTPDFKLNAEGLCENCETLPPD